MRPTSSVVTPLLGAVTVAAVASLRFVDRVVAEGVTHLPQFVIQASQFVSGLGHSTKYIIASAAGTLLFGFVWKRRRLLGFSLLMFGAIVWPGLLVNLLKYLVGRPRPMLWLERNQWELDPLIFTYDYNSFPSGHSSTSFGLAVALGVVWPRLRPLWFTLAVVVALTRVIGQAHYVSDVIVGATLGAMIAWWWSLQVRRWHPELAPAPDDARA